MLGMSIAKRLGLSIVFVSLSLVAPNAQAWDGHESIVSALQPELNHLGFPVSGYEAVLRHVGDPDNGMDANLDDSWDPLDERKWMGGTKGPTSAGFRHMYFGGWQIAHPIATFQIPIKAIGQAPERVAENATHAKHLLKAALNAESRADGFKKLGWSFHYAQDLAQPFHSVQVLTPRMIPWKELLAWPPKRGFGNLVREATRTVSNYHWAYEGYVRHRLRMADSGVLQKCLAQSKVYANLELEDVHSPKELAYAVSRASVRLGPKLGGAVIEFFGKDLMSPDYDLPNGKGHLDYSALATRADVKEHRAKLEEVTCAALANAAQATLWLAKWALR
ncbi:MAG: hypothetical protein A2428_17425 [Bdellovibrionales bacterium RIFOXYC1_FULL_54_43]|nr:MAG: hypothetical protein A2428_17425 [Bdellovibrionales bacterium RIFOXYC1_FULL_54_43]OFZ83421.1 MAG: hypothetical protein A2603_05695 [Bdellovibrionales bacterium RIFOXYD1_FULL_55_31]